MLTPVKAIYIGASKSLGEQKEDVKKGYGSEVVRLRLADSRK